MISIREGIHYTPFAIKDGEIRSRLLRIKIPLLSDMVLRILSGDRPYEAILLDYERALKSMAYRLAALGGHVLYISSDYLYISVWDKPNLGYTVMRRLQVAINNAFYEKRVLMGDLKLDIHTYLPRFIRLDKENEVSLLDIVPIEKEFSTKLQILPLDSREEIPEEGLNFLEDAVYFEIKVFANEKKELTKVLNFVHRLKEFGACIYFVPIVEEDTLLIKGVFTKTLQFLKDDIPGILDFFKGELGKDFNGTCTLGVGNVVCGLLKLESVSLPLILFKHKGKTLQEERIWINEKLLEITPERGFVVFHRVPFIGRLDELEKFKDFFDRKKDTDNPYYVNISGVPGIGKSRFVEELLKSIKSIEEHVHIFNIDFPRTAGGDIYNVLFAVAYSLGLGPLKKGVPISDIAGLIREKLKALSFKGRIIIVFEDIDSLTEESLNFISSTIISGGMPGMFIITTSKERIIPLYVPRDRFLHIELNSLKEESLKYMVLELLGGFPTHNFLKFVYDRTQGIPLYVIELLSRLKAQNRIVENNGYYDIDIVSKNNVESLEDIIGNYYDSLSGNKVKTLIDVMAVYGNEIPVHIMESVFHSLSPRGNFEEVFKELLETSFVTVNAGSSIFPGVVVNFKNDLFREVILEKIPANRVSRLRNELIKALEQDRRIFDILKYRMLSDIARNSGLIEKHVKYLYKCAQEHIKVNSFDTAYSMLRQLLPYDDHIKDINEFYRILTDIALQTGNYEDAGKYFEKAMKIADEKSQKALLPLGVMIYAAMGKMDAAKRYLNSLDPNKYTGVERGYIYSAMGTCYIREGDYEKAVEHLIEAKKNLESGNSVLYITVLSNLASVYEKIGEFHKALSIDDEALLRAKSIYHSHFLMAIYHNKSILYTHLGRYNEAIDALRESAFWAEQMNLIRALAYIYNTRGILYFEFGRYEEALSNLLKAYENVMHTEDIRQRASVLANMGFAEAKLGLWEESERHLLDSLKIRKELNDERGISNNLFYLAELQRQMERFTESADNFNESIRIKEKVGDKMGLLYVHGYYSLMQSEAGDFEQAYKLTKKGLKLTEELDDAHAKLLLKTALVHAFIGLGRVKDAHEVIVSLIPELADTQYFHVESLAYYLAGICYERLLEHRKALQYHLVAMEKTKTTGEKKVQGYVLERILNIIKEQRLDVQNFEEILNISEDVIKFYNENGLKDRAKRLSLTISEM